MALRRRKKASVDWPSVDTTDIFKAYDIRGTYPDQLNERVARRWARHLAPSLNAPRIVIARDMRASGESLLLAFAKGARAVGVEVVDIGLASTDFLYFASGYLGVPGAMFTASHNPAKYNGIKLCLAGARPVGTESGLVDVEELTNQYYESPGARRARRLLDSRPLERVGYPRALLC